jgi:fucose 4-O-acetylase-like acetyltransferase
MPPSKSRIQFLDSLRAIAIVMVIGQHALGYSQLSPEVQAACKYWFQIAVPVFFLVDGYLFFHKLERIGKLDYAKYIGESARRLVGPWVFFSGLYFITRLVYEYFGHPLDYVVLGRDSVDLLVAVWVGAPAVQMYFLLSLFFVRSFAFATKHLRGVRPIFIFAAVWMMNGLWGFINGMTIGGFQLKASWGGGQDPLLHAVWGLQYYFLGCALYVSNSWLSKRAMLLAAGATTAFMAISFGEFGVPVLAQYSYLCSFYLLFLAIGDQQRLLGEIGASTMGVYLLHQPIILKATSVLGASLFDGRPVSCYLAVVIGTLICSIGGTRLLMKIPLGHKILGGAHSSST